MNKENAQIGSCQDISNAEADLTRWAERECRKPRPIDDELCNIAYERGHLGDRICKLEGAIKANPDAVSEKHKRLWKYQLAAMESYYNILGDRIRDFVDQTQHGTPEQA